MHMSDGMKFMAAWRLWVRDHLTAAALLAGLVATQMATVVGYWLTGIGLPQLDWNRANGAIFTPGTSASVQFLSGGIFHYIDGVVFAVVFVAGVYPWLPGRATAAVNLAKAMAMGTLLALISVLFMIPRVYFPQLHPGFFSHNLGWKLVLAVFLWHWVWGLNLGLVFNPAPPAGSMEEANFPPVAKESVSVPDRVPLSVD
jgi:hypothetical protein